MKHDMIDSKVKTVITDHQIYTVITHISTISTGGRQ